MWNDYQFPNEQWHEYQWTDVDGDAPETPAISSGLTLGLSLGM